MEYTAFIIDVSCMDIDYTVKKDLKNYIGSIWQSLVRISLTLILFLSVNCIAWASEQLVGRIFGINRGKLILSPRQCTLYPYRVHRFNPPPSWHHA